MFFVDGDNFEVNFSYPMENVKIQEKDWTKDGHFWFKGCISIWFLKL